MNRYSLLRNSVKNWLLHGKIHSKNRKCRDQHPVISISLNISMNRFRLPIQYSPISLISVIRSILNDLVSNTRLGQMSNGTWQSQTAPVMRTPSCEQRASPFASAHPPAEVATAVPHGPRGAGGQAG